jgi:lactoylglutathione lyase
VGIQGFSHVGLCVSDLERSTRFYTEVLGFRELWTMVMGDEVAATMELRAHPAIRFESRMLARGDLRVELLHWLDPAPEGDRTRRPMNRYGMTHLCFRVDDVDDLTEAATRWGGEAHDATRSELDNAGVDGAPVRLLYLTDPDGIRIECMSGTPDLSRLDPRAG